MGVQKVRHFWSYEKKREMKERGRERRRGREKERESLYQTVRGMCHTE